MIRPTEMKKVSIIGPRSRMDAVIQRLHALELLHIDEYEDARDDLDIGDPQEDAEELSDQLVRLRSLKSKLPDVEDGTAQDVDDIETALDEVGDEVASLEDELDEVQRSREEKQGLLEKLALVDRLGIDLELVRDYEHLDIYIGTVDDHTFTDELEDGRYELYTDDDAIGLFVDTELDVADALRSSGFDGIDVAPLKEIRDSASAAKAKLREEIQQLDEREARLQDQLDELGATWHDVLEEQEYELAEDLEQAEAPLRFATTKSAFVAEGWVPAERYDEVVSELEDATQDTVHIDELEDDEGAPVQHDNPKGVEPLESLIGLYGVPSYKEVDPTFLLLTFPLLFGFMLGDIGYGLASFAVFYGFLKMFPEGKKLWYSLMYTSIATIAFGLAYGEMFGFQIFGTVEGALNAGTNDLTAVTGMTIFEQVPVLFARAHHLSTVLYISVLIGVVHVNLGFLIGAYNEYLHHGIKEAVLAKLSWMVVEAGALIWALLGMQTVGGAVLVLGIVMLAMGEGIEGVVELPSLLSNILSYLRVFGVSIAVVALALVVNVIAQPLFQSGSIVMALLGVVILVIGHALNTFIKVLEAGLQGIRLHYVEFFTKFFEGGGTYYKPFGANPLNRNS